MTRISSSRPPVTGRYTQDGWKKAQAQLKKMDTAIKKKSGDVDSQKRLLRTARFATPADYKKAVAQLHTLEKQLKTLQKDRDAFVKRMTHA